MSEALALQTELEGADISDDASASFPNQLRTLLANWRLMLGLGAVAAGLAMMFAGPLVVHWDPLAQDLPSRLKPGFWDSHGATGHPFGTDSFGRDELSRLLYGARFSMSVAVVGVLASGVIGTALALCSGYWSGWPEQLIMRAVDLQQALPPVLLALLIVALYGNSISNLIIVLGLTGWASYTRVLFSQTRILRSAEFVTAARALGARPSRILIRHVLPSLMPELFVLSSLQVGRNLLLATGLSFLGLGVPIPLPEWGSMLAEGQRVIYIAPWLTTIPGLTITLAVLAFNLLGDGLRRMVDPRAQALA